MRTALEDAPSRALLWFVAASCATLLLLHPGFDTTEGGDHARTAMHWIETGAIGHASPPSGVYIPAPNGLYYPVHEIGAVLVHVPAAPAALAAESLLGLTTLPGSTVRISHLLLSFNSIVIALVAAIGFWKWMEWGFGAPVGARLRGTALLLFATMMLPYARMLSDVSATAAWLTWGAALGARASGGGAGWALAAGAAWGGAIMTRIPSAVVVAPLALAMLARAASPYRARLALLATIGALPAIGALLWFNDIRTGSPFIPGFLVPSFAIVRPGSGSLPIGVAGLLASPGKAIFVFSPLLLLAIPGWHELWRTRRIDAISIAGALVGFLVVHGSLFAWHADWGWGPRHFMFALPIVWLPGAMWLAGRRRMRQAVVVAVIAISFAVQAVAVTVNWHYQYQFMWADGRLNDSTPWRLDNQMTDAFRAAPANLARAAGINWPAREPLSGMSAFTIAASTGVNVWWVTALRLGVARVAVWPIVLVLAGFTIALWRRTWRAARDQ